MAKIKPKLMDQDSAMERILGLRRPEIAEDTIVKKSKEITDLEADISTNKTENKIDDKDKNEEDNKKAKKKYIQTAFYITKEQHHALKLRALQSKDPKEKDMSAIVRTILNEYLKL